MYENYVDGLHDCCAEEKGTGTYIVCKNAVEVCLKLVQTIHLMLCINTKVQYLTNMSVDSYCMLECANLEFWDNF